MKSLSVKLLFVLSLFALLILGVDWMLETSDLGIVFFGPKFHWEGIRSLENRTLVRVVGSAAVLLPMLTASAWVLFGRDRTIKVQTRNRGVIRLAPRAVEDAICREVRQNVVDVTGAAAVAKQGKGKAPAVTLTIRVSDRLPVPDIESTVRTEAVKVLNKLFGVADGEQVRIEVVEVRGGAARAARPTRPSRPNREDRPKRPAAKGEGEKAAPVAKRTPRSVGADATTPVDSAK